jgi:hypothetical protein
MRVSGVLFIMAPQGYWKQTKIRRSVKLSSHDTHDRAVGSGGP